MSSCSACGQFLGRRPHQCATVCGERRCTECDAVLSNEGYERWKRRCRSCEKKRWRTVERALRAQLRAQLGGTCQRCGYARCSAALHFHHRHGRTDSPNRPGRVSLAEVRDYPQRFELLCANCHIEEHFGGKPETIRVAIEDAEKRIAV